MPGRNKKLTDDEIMEIIRSHPDRAVTAAELARELDITSQGLLKRLDQLSASDKLRKKKVGGSAVVWWVKGDYGSVNSEARS